MGVNVAVAHNFGTVAQVPGVEFGKVLASEEPAFEESASVVFAFVAFAFAVLAYAVAFHADGGEEALMDHFGDCKWQDLAYTQNHL